ncbi:MAG: YiaA/YiaB family inner membrane protein [Leptolyngbyaceae cyanobacterium bins.349]|nr:YiaA/YiaB family inner membrane protein [Leptolyngbyaceae cyanobacterium bins.349]
MAKFNAPQAHSSAWIAQAWISFIVSGSAMIVGILYLPVDNWMKGYLGMGYLFATGSTISLSKTIRDMHESNKVLSRVDEAKLEKLLAEYDPFKK